MTTFRSARDPALRLSVLFAVLAALGCSSGDSAKPAGCEALAVDAGQDVFPCDVDAVLEAKCRRCHASAAVLDVCVPAKTCARAPFPLLVWSDTRRDMGDGRVVYEHMIDVVRTDFMPLQDPSLQPPVEKLTDAEKRTLLDWLEAGAPAGQCQCSTPP